MNTGRGAFGRIEAAFDRRAEKFTFRHPYLTILIMFIAVPFGMLAVRDFFRLVVCHRSLLPGWFYRMLVFYHTPGNPLKIMSVKREATCPSIFGENPMKGRCTGRREEYWFTV